MEPIKNSKNLLPAVLALLALTAQTVNAGGTTHETSSSIPHSSIAPQIHQCTETFDLIDSNGVYLKTACWLWYGFTYASGQDECRRLGMELLTLNNASVYTALTKQLTNRFGVGKGAIVWVNGLQDPSGEWFSYNPDKKPVIAEAIPRHSYSAEYRCLQVDGYFGSFVASTYYPCSSKFSPYCEYTK